MDIDAKSAPHAIIQRHSELPWQTYVCRALWLPTQQGDNSYLVRRGSVYVPFFRLRVFTPTPNNCSAVLLLLQLLNC
jgi:hypothetical protein